MRHIVFGITFHRNKRSKNFTTSSLMSIPGVGSKTIEKVLSNFNSVENIKNISLNELGALIGNDKAKKISNFLNDATLLE